MSDWKDILRRGVLPLMPWDGLVALRGELLAAEAGAATRLPPERHRTTVPPPLEYARDMAVERADPVGLCGWAGYGLATVGQVDAWRAWAAAACDRRVGRGAFARWLAAWDDGDATPALLYEEVEIELRGRAAAFRRLPLAVLGDAA